MVDPMVDTLETHNGLGWPKRNLQSHMSHVFGWTNGWTIENSRWAWLAHWKLLHCLCHCPSIQLCRNRHCVLVLLEKCTFLKSWILNSMRPALWCFRSWLRIENAPSLLRSAFAYNLECPAFQNHRIRIKAIIKNWNYWSSPSPASWSSPPCPLSSLKVETWWFDILVLYILLCLIFCPVSSLNDETWYFYILLLLIFLYFVVVDVLIFDIFVLFPPWKMELDVQQ